MESPGKEGGMILWQIKTPFAVGDVCVKVGSSVRAAVFLQAGNVYLQISPYPTPRRPPSCYKRHAAGKVHTGGRRNECRQPWATLNLNISKEKHEGHLE